jgi:hypothetical protein
MWTEKDESQPADQRNLQELCENSAFCVVFDAILV